MFRGRAGINPPFQPGVFEQHLFKGLSLALHQRTVVTCLGPFSPNEPWYEFLLEKQIPIIHFDTPLIYLDEDNQLVDINPTKNILILLGARGTSIQISNSPTGVFSLPEEWCDSLSLPPPPLDFEFDSKQWDIFFQADDLPTEKKTLPGILRKNYSNTE